MSLPFAILLFLAGALTMAAFARWRGRLLSRALETMRRQVEEGATGRRDKHIDETGHPELRALARSLNQLVARQLENATDSDVVFSSIPEGTLVTDRRGVVQHINPAFRRLFRVQGEDNGGDLTQLTGFRELELLVLDTLNQGGTRMLELDPKVESPNAGSASRHLVVSCTVLQDGSGAVLTARDITASMLLGQIRRDLVANVSHEIKTPLTAIRGFAETLRDGALAHPETAVRFTDRILQQCDRLQALLSDLLTLSRLERSETPAERRTLKLGTLVSEALETLQAAADEREVTLVAHFDLDPVLEGDAEALSELCLNLIDNAIKYNERGGQVEARLSRRDGEIVLEISDTGRGIPKAALARIFERFYRVDRGRSRTEGGTGLGLAIAKHAAEIHGGRIEVESQLGKGSTFRVYLPPGDDG